MSIELPGPVVDLIELYGFSWPDINEDGFKDLEQPLRDFSGSVDGAGETIEDSLRLLSQSNPSLSLQSLVGHIQTIREEFLRPLSHLCDELAGWPCQVAYDGIVALKVSIIACTAYEFTEDAPELASIAATGGTDAPEAFAIIVAERQYYQFVVRSLIDSAVSELSRTLQNNGKGIIDKLTQGLTQPFVNRVVNVLEGDLNSYSARFLSSVARDVANGEEFGETRIHLNPEALIQSVINISKSLHQLASATSAMKLAVLEVVARPDPSCSGLSQLDQQLRIIMHDVLETLVTELGDGVKELVQSVITHFTNLLKSYERELRELDEKAQAVASSQKMTMPNLVKVRSLSGLGSAVAASRIGISAAVDVGKDKSVQVGSAVVETNTTNVSGAVTTAPMQVGSTPARDEIEVLVLPVDGHEVIIDVSNGTHNGVENLSVTIHESGPKVGVVDGRADSVQTTITSSSSTSSTPIFEVSSEEP